MNPKEFFLILPRIFILFWDTKLNLLRYYIVIKIIILHKFEGKSFWKVKISLENYFWISLDIALTVKVTLEQSLATQYSDCKKIFG